MAGGKVEGGRVPDRGERPHTHGWRAAMDKAHAAPRCCARTRSGFSCQSPAMPNGRCRMHGGASTGAKTEAGKAKARRANWKHGRRSAAYLATRREIAQAVRDLNATIRAFQSGSGSLEDVRGAWDHAAKRL